MKISVCMATFNGEKYIQQQIESILLQLSEYDELIISDNLSTDNTLNIITSFQDKRIILYNYEIKNLIKNFENALSKANGDIICLSDQDDIWLSGRINRIKKEIITSDLIMLNCRVVDENLNTIRTSLFEPSNVCNSVVSNIIKNSFTGCCMAFNRKILRNALPFPNDISMHDWWIGLIGEWFGKVIFISDPYLLYRRHQYNASNTTSKSTFGLVRKFSIRFIMLKNLIFRACGYQ